MKTALVTGSAGFIGRHLVPKLGAAGYSVTGIDPAELSNLSAKPPGHHRWNWLSFEEWLCTQVEPQESFECIVHLAANIESVDVRLAGGLRQYQDIALDLALAEYVLKHPPREALIVPSSCAIDNPEDPYAWVKLTGERFWMELHRAGVPVVILRPFSGYSEDQTETYPFPAILARAMRHEDPLIVWGDGHQVRDFIHVEDLTDAFIHAINKFPRGVPIDIGTGRGTSFWKLAEMVSVFADYEPRIWADVSKPASSRRRVADTTLARAHGFEAKISLEEGIRKSLPDFTMRAKNW